MNAHTLSIVVPAYNEEVLIKNVILEMYFTCRQLFSEFEIIIIDDCSSDETYKIATCLSEIYHEIRVVRNSRNLGCHPSVRIGFDNAQMQWFAFLPGDGQIPPSILQEAALSFQELDFICTHRHARNDDLHRVIISKIYNVIIRLITGLKIRDFDSAILIRRDVYFGIRDRIRSQSASISVELAVHATMFGGRVGEIRIPHRPRLGGTARGLNWRDIRGVPQNLLRMVLIVAPLRLKRWFVKGK